MSLNLDTFEAKYIQMVNEVYTVDISTIDFKTITNDDILDTYNLITLRLTDYIQKSMEPTFNFKDKHSLKLNSIHYFVAKGFALFEGKLLAKKIRDCNSLEEFISVCNTDGLKYLKNIFIKSDLKKIELLVTKEEFFNTLLEVISITVFTYYCKKTVFNTEEGLNSCKKTLRADFLDDGYSLFGYYIYQYILYIYIEENISDKFEDELISNGSISKKHYLNPNIAISRLSLVDSCILRASENESFLDHGIKVLLDYIDKFIETSVDAAEDRLEKIIESKEIDVNMYIEKLNTLEGFSSYEDLKSYVLDLMSNDLKQSEIRGDLVLQCADIISILKMFTTKLKQWQKDFNSSSARRSKFKTLRDTFINLANFLQEYLITRTMEETIYRDKELLEFTKSSIRRYLNDMKNEQINENQLDTEINHLFRNNESTIYDYKELNKLANDFGFEATRQAGSHRIFKKSDGTTVVIPQGRAIGKGLNLKIQKDILQS